MRSSKAASRPGAAGAIRAEAFKTLKQLSEKSKNSEGWDRDQSRNALKMAFRGVATQSEVAGGRLSLFVPSSNDPIMIAVPIREDLSEGTLVQGQRWKYKRGPKCLASPPGQSCARPPLQSMHKMVHGVRLFPHTPCAGARPVGQPGLAGSHHLTGRHRMAHLVFRGAGHALRGRSGRRNFGGATSIGPPEQFSSRDADPIHKVGCISQVHESLIFKG